jgi:hypothetical protein
MDRIAASDKAVACATALSSQSANALQQSPELVVDAVEAVLQSYARRGVIRELCQVNGRTSHRVFHFGWLHNQPYTITCDVIRKKLAMTDLLPGMARDSLIFKELKAFVKSRSQTDVDAHRRIDPERMRVAILLRAGVVTIEMTVIDTDFAFATNRLINLVHEVFLFLSEYWADYLFENFQRDME